MKKRAVFLDRDGVINELVYDPEQGTVDSPFNPQQFKLLTGVGKSIKTINGLGLLAIVVSNQPGIAKGKFGLCNLKAIDEKMYRQLKAENAYLDAVYYCLHHPQARLQKYRRNCNCRKPKPGLLLKGGDAFQIDLKKSYMVGDGLTDILAGKSAGCKTILLGNPKCDLCHLMKKMKAKPDFIVRNLQEAVNLIKRMGGKKCKSSLTQQTLVKLRNG